jgi:hypothetical protein
LKPHFRHSFLWFIFSNSRQFHFTTNSSFPVLEIGFSISFSPSNDPLWCRKSDEKIIRH